jgi:hypothetical protein
MVYTTSFRNSGTGEFVSRDDGHETHMASRLSRLFGLRVAGEVTDWREHGGLLAMLSFPPYFVQQALDKQGVAAVGFWLPALLNPHLRSMRSTPASGVKDCETLSRAD